MKKVSWILFVLFGCSQINPEEQAYYQELKNIRHGINQVKPNVSEVTLANRGGKDLLKIGEHIYKRDCARCHGDSGEGNGPLAKAQKHPPMNLKMTVKQVSNFDFYFSISQMNKSMPGWDQPYSDEERKAIALYLKTL